MTRFRFGALALVPLLAACHAYSHASLADLAGGDDVRALLTPAQADELRDALGTPGGGPPPRVVEGLVVEAGPDGLLLEVPVYKGVEGIEVESLHQRVRIGEGGLADLERRSLDRRRTYAVVGVVAGAVGYFLWDQLRSRGRRGGQPPGSRPAESPPGIGFSVPFRVP